MSQRRVWMRRGSRGGTIAYECSMSVLKVATGGSGKRREMGCTGGMYLGQRGLQLRTPGLHEQLRQEAVAGYQWPCTGALSS